MKGVTTRQMALERQCSPAAVYAMKRRLILCYSQPSHHQQLRTDLQRFVAEAAKKWHASQASLGRGKGRPKIDTGDRNVPGARGGRHLANGVSQGLRPVSSSTHTK